LKDLDVLTRSQLEDSLHKGKTEPRNDPDPVQEPRAESAEDLRIADEIQRSLGMKVRLVRSVANSENGKLTLEFYGEGDLQILFRKLIAD
jgi:hypothetical protein